MSDDENRHPHWVEDIDEYLERRYHEMREAAEKRAREEAEQGKAFHSNLTITIGTIGAIAFAGLVLVIQDQNQFTVSTDIFLTPRESFDLLIVVLASVSGLSAFSVLLTTFAGAGIVEPMGPVGATGFAFGAVAMVGFVISILLVLGAISNAAANLYAVVLGAACVVLVIAFRKENNRRSR